MEHDKMNTNRWWVLCLALLVLAACSRSVAVGERFTLWQGEVVRVKGAGLTIEITALAYQQPGSQTPGDGFVQLRVVGGDEGETEVALMAGQEATIGGYTIRLERLLASVDGEGCELVVSGP